MEFTVFSRFWDDDNIRYVVSFVGLLIQQGAYEGLNHPLLNQEYQEDVIFKNFSQWFLMFPSNFKWFFNQIISGFAIYGQSLLIFNLFWPNIDFHSALHRKILRRNNLKNVTSFMDDPLIHKIIICKILNNKNSFHDFVKEQSLQIRYICFSYRT